MGAAASTKGGGESSGVERQERREEESLAASTGSLPMLQRAFPKLCHPPQSHAVPLPALEEVFCLKFTSLQSKSFRLPEHFPQLLNNLGPSIVDLFFRPEGDEVTWVGFLRGFNRCTGRMPASALLNILYRLYSTSSRKANKSIELEFDSDDSDSKLTGNLMMSDVLMLLWMSWIIEHASRISNALNETVVLPDLYHLVTSAFICCGEVHDDSSIENTNHFDLATKIHAQKLHLWILKTIPGLAHTISKFVQNRLEASISSKDEVMPSTSSIGDDSSWDVHSTFLLTCGRAWAILLTLRSFNDELLELCFPRKDGEALDNLLYRSSIHGKGLSRFWSNVEGYHGPLLILLAARSVDSSGDSGGCKQWIIAMLMGQGFDNRDTFFGSSGYLFAVNPIFRAFPASGKEKNFMYCHLHHAGRVYDPHPMPVGVAFGGTPGNERIFIDEDFSTVTIRHHAVDKTYQHGSLIPNQGFLPTTASVLDVEVWGLGGKNTKLQQDAYKKRESLFSEQRRKVDLKTFATWEDSPEKMMMDMVSDPNRVKREDR